MPPWLRWLVGIALAGGFLLALEGTGFTDLGFTAGACLLVAWLMWFPGRRPGFPRLFGLMALLWIVLVPVFLLFVLVDDAWRELAIELGVGERADLFRALFVPYVVLFPLLVVTLLKRFRSFRFLVLLTAAYDVLLHLLLYAHRSDRAAAEVIATTCMDVLLEVAVTAYLLVHFRPRGKAPEAAP